MDIRLRSITCAVSVALLASACAGREARDFGGRWTPANAYASSAEAIPIDAAHVYQASPMDGTLRALLARWARDAGSTLDYRHPSDFTLHQPVGEIRARSLGDAVARLGDAFAPQGVVMRLEDARLVVLPRDDGGG